MKKVKLLCLLLVLLMLLPACSTQPAGTTTPPDSATPPPASTPGDPTQAPERGPIEITTVGTTVGDMVLTYLEQFGENDQDNRWLRKIQEELDITVKYLWTAGSADEYVQKLNLSLVSGDIPDIIPFSSLSQVRQAMMAGYVVDAKPYFDQYGSPLLKEIYDLDLNVEMDACTFDGVLGAIPRIMPAHDSIQVLYIRKDWLDVLGISDPKSQQDVIDIMKAFSEQDPDGNGIDDTYGMLLNGDIWGAAGISGFCAAYDAYPNIWYDDGSGQLVYGSVQPQMKKALTMLNEMYGQGLFDPEFVINNVVEQMVAGKAGVAYGPDSTPWLLQLGHNYDGAMWSGYVPMHESNEYAKVPVRSATSGSFGINKSFAHPEALLEIMNLHAEMCWGETAEGDVYFGAGEGEGMWRLNPFSFLHPHGNYLILEGVTKGLEQGSADGIFPAAVGFYEGVRLYRDEKNENAWSNEYVFSPNPYASIVVNKFQVDNDLIFPAVKTWTQSEEDRGVVCNKHLTDAFVKMIMGEMPVSEFDNVVSQWYTLGGQQMLEDKNDWYSTMK